MSFGCITKLNVNINKCQTHITYANNSTRFLINNPSGFVFRSMGSTVCRCCTDCASQGIGFLKRHFGRGGSIRKTPSLCDMLLSIGLNDYAHYEPNAVDHKLQSDQMDDGDHQESDEQQVKKLFTWHLEDVPVVKPQRATKIVRRKGRLQVSCLAWHLDSCKWRNFSAKDYEMPKCHCLKIKDTMDYIDEVVNGAMPTPEQQQSVMNSNGKLIPEMNSNIIGINALLQKLNELLEEQNREQGNV
ncbi:uncharacterized protein LOC6580904 [Drosophila mojavensis]|uniref:Uncharacterized protein n=2 Tax=mojavensis species complex TaxID=198037 RepID=B4KTC4_DROMO|nr:uncharacterized protein LOC6580904 [Drosophila mojavensis]XP_017864954.1 PREDICTED: uncharacterized protein LOC108615158 [Drosophila arizonae]EDW10636.2 uncharacterized protein Dmoj_GI21210 [Drosophila mojavensis]